MNERIQTDGAPAPVGPYSQAVRSGGFLFCSGQVPLHPGTGALVGETIEEQTRQTLENLKAVVEAGGATLADAVKVSVFLADMEHFAAMNGVYATYFDAAKPARACVEVSRLPKDVLVEVDAIVRCPEGSA